MRVQVFCVILKVAPFFFVWVARLPQAMSRRVLRPSKNPSKFSPHQPEMSPSQERQLHIKLHTSSLNLLPSSKQRHEWCQPHTFRSAQRQTRRKAPVAAFAAHTGDAARVGLPPNGHHLSLTRFEAKQRVSKGRELVKTFSGLSCSSDSCQITFVSL